MAVHIRLTRRGAKKAAQYRIIVADHRSRRDGAFIENIGTYNPADSAFVVKRDRLDYWQSKGAQLSHTVANLLKQQIRNQAAKA